MFIAVQKNENVKICGTDIMSQRDKFKNRLSSYQNFTR